MKFYTYSLFFVMIISACSFSSGSSIASEVDAPPLESSIAADNLTMYRDETRNIIISYPTDWVIEDGDNLYIASSEDQFPWGINYFLASHEPYYYLYTRSPYLTRGDRRLQIVRTSSELAQAIAATFIIVDEQEFEIVEEVTSVDINGRDGATFLISNRGDYHYFVVIRLTKKNVVVVTATGPISAKEEMKNIVNGIALNILPVKE